MIRLNPVSGVPLYVQLVEQIKHSIESGALRAGEQLPSVRQIAEDLLINPNTVARAYRELEHEGVLEVIHGSGAYVRESVVARGQLMNRARLMVRATLDRLESLDLSEEEIRRLVYLNVGKKRFASWRKAKWGFHDQEGTKGRNMGELTNVRDFPDAGDGVIAVKDLGRRFRAKVSLGGISFRVPQGSVFGLVGE